MAYYEFLKRILEPLNLYDLNEGVGAEELRVIGEQLDRIYDSLETLLRESNPASAETFGIERYRKLLSRIQTGASGVNARSALLALLRIRHGCFTKQALTDTVGGCGLPAVVSETDTANVVNVSFPTIRGVPADFESLQRRVEEILPCHLDIRYEFIYILWRDYQNMFSSWRQAESCCGSWREFQSYVP